MKTYPLFLLGILVISSFNSFSYQKGVALFEETNFRGDHRFISSDWSCENYFQICFSIESIMVPDGWEIWVYEDANFKGDHMRLTSSWDGTGHNSHLWRDDIRSIRIVSTSPFGCNHNSHRAAGSVTVFEHHFEGSSKKINNNWTAGGHEGSAWNDRISSIHVLDGMRVRAYEHANFTGSYIDITGFWKANGGYWNDRISSIQILR